MATMLNGAAVMDAALLLVAGNETCPQPQTSEHLAAIEIMKLKHIIILQNKVDLIREQQAEEHQASIAAFVKGTVADGAPIVPISAQLKYNIDAINEYLCTRVPVPVREFTSDPRLIVIRSFDVNKPGAEVSDLKGGVAGGSILNGVLKLGQEVEVRPGLVTKDKEGKTKCQPIFSKVASLLAEKNELQFAVPGGLIGVGTLIECVPRRLCPLPSLVSLKKRHLPAMITCARKQPLTLQSGQTGRPSAGLRRQAARHLHRARSQLLPFATTSRCQEQRQETDQSPKAFERRCVPLSGPVVLSFPLLT